MSSSLRKITIEDLYKYKPVSSPRISPDGKRVAFVVTTIDERKHEYRSAIWMVSTEGGEAQRFTAGPANASNPSWSPDGRWLAFVSERAGAPAGKDEQEPKKKGKSKTQVWLIPTDGRKTRQSTFAQACASNPAWSPDTKRGLIN